MTSELATQLAQLVFIALIFLPCLVILAALVYFSVRVMPVVLRLVQRLSDNNEELTKLTKAGAEQNAGQMNRLNSGLDGLTSELVKQTVAINTTNTVLTTQGIDFRNYQTLVSDGLSNHGMQIEANTTKLAALELSLSTLPEKIVEVIRDEAIFAPILVEFQKLRNEVNRAMFQQSARITGTHPIVPVNTPPPPLPPTPSEIKNGTDEKPPAP